MKKSTLDATKLRWILLALIVFTIGGGAVGAWYLQGTLSSQMVATNKIKADASNSSGNLEKARNLKAYLAKNQDSVQKTALVVADTTSYKYQNQIVEDITRYANIAGVTILGFQFPATAATSKPTSATGLNTVAANITLQNPVSYLSYLKFLKFIENNLTKMQITDISVTPDANNPWMVANPVIGIEVYTK